MERILWFPRSSIFDGQESDKLVPEKICVRSLHRKTRTSAIWKIANNAFFASDLMRY
jgi:hypothetical protein